MSHTVDEQLSNLRSNLRRQRVLNHALIALNFGLACVALAVAAWPRP